MVTCYIAGVDVEWPLMKVIITFTFCCSNLWKSKFMAPKKPGKLGEFFLLLCGYAVRHQMTLLCRCSMRKSWMCRWCCLMKYWTMCVGVLWGRAGCAAGAVWWSTRPCATHWPYLPAAAGSPVADRSQWFRQDHVVSFRRVDEWPERFPSESPQ